MPGEFRAHDHVQDFLLSDARLIRSTAEILATVRQGTPLRTGFPYPGWEERIEAALGVYNVRSIKPYDILRSQR